jgi:hypothetical protein
VRLSERQACSRTAVGPERTISNAAITKFQPPKGCSVVSGDIISAKGWCKLYETPPE